MPRYTKGVEALWKEAFLGRYSDRNISKMGNGGLESMVSSCLTIII